MRTFILLICLFTPLWSAYANDTTKNHTIVVLGDSLAAGYGLPAGQGFPEQLEAFLKPNYPALHVINAGISGDTTAGGRARITLILEQNPDIVIIVLGGNDILRGLPPEQTRNNLDFIIKTLTDKNIKVLLAGFMAPPNYGREYGDIFNPIYPDLAKKYHAGLYPFFLDGVYGNASLNLLDGMHPNSKGIHHIVERIAPLVTDFLE